MNALRELLSNELREPSEKFIRFMAGDVYSGRVTERIVEQFRDLLKRSFQQLVSDMVTERLKSALQKEATEAKEIKEEQEANEPPRKRPRLRPWIQRRRNLSGTYWIRTSDLMRVKHAL
jgi:hypothetical protein